MGRRKRRRSSSSSTSSSSASSSSCSRNCTGQYERRNKKNRKTVSREHIISQSSSSRDYRTHRGNTKRVTNAQISSPLPNIENESQGMTPPLVAQTNLNSRNLEVIEQAADVNVTSQSSSSVMEETESRRRIQELENLVGQLRNDCNRSKANVNSNCIPEFNPNIAAVSCSKWLDKIEQLGQINNWDENLMIFHMQGRLEGLAKTWYTGLDNYRHSWTEWKRMLNDAFPDHRDFPNTLRKLIKRVKLPGESWIEYYFGKMELLRQCDISGKNAVDMLIDGLFDSTVKSGAKVGRYHTPEDLFRDYLSALPPMPAYVEDHVKLPTKSSRALEKRERTHQPNVRQKLGQIRCFNCRTYGHGFKDCKKPKVQCSSCKRLGHLAANCRDKSNIPRKTLLCDVEPHSSSDGYYVTCELNGRSLRGFIDSGCEVVLIRESDARKIGLEWTYSEVCLNGYGGAVCRVIGTVKTHLKVDLFETETPVFVVSDNLQTMPVLVGRSVLNIIAFYRAAVGFEPTPPKRLVPQTSDKQCRHIVDVLSKKPTNNDEKQIHKDYLLKGNKLYRKTPEGTRWYVPKASRRVVTMVHHDQMGHFAVDRTLKNIKNKYWFPAMRKYVSRYISACLQCAYNKVPTGKREGFLHSIEKVPTPMDTIHIDHLGPFVKSSRGNMYLIVAVDAFTKFLYAKAVPSTRTKPVVNFLESIFLMFGTPRRIVCDRGTGFTSNSFRCFAKELGIKLVFNATATPRANGQVERYNRTLLNAISTSHEDEKRWDESISSVVFGINSSTNSSTGKSPYTLLVGYTPRSMTDAFLSTAVVDDIVEKDLSKVRQEAAMKIQKAQGKQKAYFDYRRKTCSKYNIGDQVVLQKTNNVNDGKSKKILPKFSGPYRVKEILDNDRYIVEDLEGSKRARKRYQGVSSADRMKPFEAAFQSSTDTESEKVSDNEPSNRRDHLILETDPEKGKGEYAFDNPGFKDTTLPLAKHEEDKLETSKSKWDQWSPLTALTNKSEKRKTQDDTAIESFQGNEVKVVALRSHDFTGLGFNICGNMKEGIYIKDILHRGPAFESRKLNIGDRINSVTISFEHMVYEDALTILSYASPYEVIIEAKNGKLIQNTSGQGGQPSHPVYRSSSCIDLHNMEKSSRKKLFGDDYNSSSNSNYSSLQKSRSNMTSLERKESKSPMPNQPRSKKTIIQKNLTPEQLKSQLEQRIMADHLYKLKAKDKMPKGAEMQKSEPKIQKFGIRVLPLEQQKSPKIMEQNENNVHIEKRMETVDEPDETKQPPPIKKRERKAEESPEKVSIFDRNSLNSSGIKRDENGIPQELPTYMLNAAIAVRKNRNSFDQTMEEDGRNPKRKGKAPSPPDELNMNFDEIQPLAGLKNQQTVVDSKEQVELDIKPRSENDYNSDSDVETDTQSSVNTIELNSNEITIHQIEAEDKKNRKTVSTGDLTKFQKTRIISSGTLERAQSLDISDSDIPPLNRKHKGEDNFDVIKSEEDLFGKLMLNKEPKLSLIVDGLTTFQRNRLKKSTEWGNLEDAILKLNQEDANVSNGDDNISLERISLTENTPEFDAVVNKIKEIKRESLELPTPVETKTDASVKNEIWPTFDIKQQSSNGLAHMIPSGKDISFEVETSAEINSDNIESEIKEPEIFIKPVKPAVPPPPAKITKINNKINEPFEIIHTTQFIAETRQMKPSVIVTPSPIQSEPDKTEKISIECDRISTRQRVPEEVTILPAHSKLEGEKEVELTHDWKISCHDSIIDTSPPMSLELVETLDQEPELNKDVYQPKQVLSKIPFLNSIVKNQKEESLNRPLMSTNNTDETKTVVTYNLTTIEPNLLDVTQNFLYTEQLNYSQDDVYLIKLYDTNISDDIKVSRHSHGTSKREIIPKCDDAKTEDNLRHISNVSVSNSVNGDQELHSLELSINDKSDLYTTALDTTVDRETQNDSIVTISSPDIINNASLTDTIKTSIFDNNSYEVSPVEIPQPEVVAITENKFSSFTESPSTSDQSTSNDSSKENLTLTYITEIEVTPTKNTKSNISEVEIEANARNIDTDFENYVKTFESKLENFENNIQDFDKNLEDFIKEEPTSITENNNINKEEINKIHEIAEEQLKKLPEMRFTTSSYESPSKIPEKRFSQIEMLRSNFEKPSPKSSKADVTTKSRIPIAMTSKTPPTSPERRDSRNLENENDKAILDLMSSSATSTPYTTSKYQIKPSNKNVTVTSIRTNSKIPSGLPTLSGRPPIAPRRIEVPEVSANGNVDSSFKQWVFNPSNVTNVMVTDHKDK